MTNNDLDSIVQWEELIDLIQDDDKGMAIVAESPTLRLIQAVKQLNLAGIVKAIGEGGQIKGGQIKGGDLLDYIATKVSILAICPPLQFYLTGE